jgi:hypothetical protein
MANISYRAASVGSVPKLLLFFENLINIGFKNKIINFKFNNRVAHKLPDIFLW